MIWAITSYYNPQKYRTRFENFTLFKKNLNIPLVVVEFSHNGEFQLTKEDATILIQIPKGDIMWQKERLLNIAASHVPKDVENIAWIDCDVIFTDPEWYLKAEQLLQTNKIIQLYSHMVHLSKGKQTPTDNNIFRSSVVKHIKDYGFDPEKSTTFVELRSQVGLDNVEGAHKEPGFAWAAKRELFDNFGLYDKNIIGGGDNAIVCAIYKEFSGFVNQMWKYPRFLLPYKRTKYFKECESYYLDWATKVSEYVDGKIDCLDSTIYHLWHGDLKDRQYYSRNMKVAKIGFNPYTDLKINECGVFEWSKDTQLKEYLIKYFEIRNEDKY